MSDPVVSARPVRLELAIVTETYPPEVNGVAMTIGRLVEGLRDNGHRVRVVRPHQRKEAHATSGPMSLRDDPNGTDLTLPGMPLPGYGDLRFGWPAKRRLCAAWRQAQAPG